MLYSLTALTPYGGSILGPIAKLMGYILQGLYYVLDFFTKDANTANVGLCIILFTFIINALMIPLQIKQQKFSRLSAVMNPEIMAIQNKYKNKKDQASQQKMSMETQAVYQKYGVSPASGCLPLLITMPFLFALYRVIYNIPAYVPQVYHIYEGLADQLKAAGITIQTIVTDAGVKTNTYTVTTAINAAGKLTADKTAINYYVDILGQISSSGWKTLIGNVKYAQFVDVMKTTAREANHINSFLGLNIADTPSIKSISIVIPILSAATQIISTKISMAGMPQQNTDPNSTSAQTMKTMNTTMPLVTGLMCFMFPIGVGVYWITGNIFRIIQSLAINRIFKNMDVDEMVKENLKKAKEKYERAGMDSSALDTVARMKTSNIQAPKEEPKEKKKKSISSVAGKASTTEVKKTNTKYKKGSIADIANMLNNREED